jgi:hypothetical protein
VAGDKILGKGSRQDGDRKLAKAFADRLRDHGRIVRSGENLQ